MTLVGNKCNLNFLIGNARKSFFLSEREKRWPSGSLNCDDTIDGGVNDTLWFNGVEILVAGCFGTCV